MKRNSNNATTYQFPRACQFSSTYSIYQFPISYIIYQFPSIYIIYQLPSIYSTYITYLRGGSRYTASEELSSSSP